MGPRFHEGKDGRLSWLNPELVGQFEFVEWTADAHLRHARFVSLREDKNARDIGRERQIERRSIDDTSVAFEHRISRASRFASVHGLGQSGLGSVLARPRHQFKQTSY